MDNVNKDEEYHLTETENMNAFSVGSEKKSIFERLQRKNLVIAVIIVMVIIAVYKVIDLISSRPAEKKKAPVAVRILAKPADVAPAAQQAAPGARIAILASDQEQSQKMLNDMQAQMQAMQNSIIELNAHMNELAAGLQNVTMTLAQQQKKQQAVKKKVTHKAVAAKVSYAIQALIPGRAWLIDSSGQTLTVAPGDMLPGAGKVVVIDVNQGIVGTSSGNIIHYDDK